MIELGRGQTPASQGGAQVRAQLLAAREAVVALEEPGGVHEVADRWGRNVAQSAGDNAVDVLHGVLLLCHVTGVLGR